MSASGTVSSNYSVQPQFSPSQLYWIANQFARCLSGGSDQQWWECQLICGSLMVAITINRGQLCSTLTLSQSGVWHLGNVHYESNISIQCFRSAESCHHYCSCHHGWAVARTRTITAHEDRIVLIYQIGRIPDKLTELRIGVLKDI